MSVGKEMYERLISNRPFKFNAEEVNFRKSEGDERCGGCSHYYQRALDKFGVCEIYRTDEEDADENVHENMVCDFFNVDLEEYPLLDE